MEQTIGVILRQYIQDAGFKSQKAFLEYLNNNGVNITYNSLTRILSDDIIIDFVRAKQIFKLLKFTFSDTEIQQLIDYTKQVSKELRSEKSIDFGMKLKPESFSESFTIEELREILNDRLAELYPNEKAGMNRYVTDLIKKDLGL